MRKESEKSNLIRILEFVTLAPSVVGILFAVGVFLFQCWRWRETGIWKNTPFAEFVPHGLVEWSVTEEGSLLGLKKLVFSLLSVHASAWFFVGGVVCTMLLYEITKPWLKDKS